MHPHLLLFFRAAAFVYGPSIDHVGLRHSLLAFIALQLDTPLEQHLEHANLAIQALCWKLSKTNTLDEGDLFVSFLLALCCFGLTENAEMMISANMRGFVSIMQHLSNRVRGAIKSYQLAVFWPLARDLLGLGEYVLNLVGGEFWDDSCRVLGMTSFQQMVSYFHALPATTLPDDCIGEGSISLILHNSLRQNREMKELLRVEMARQNGQNDQATAHKLSLTSSLSVSLQDDIYLAVDDLAVNLMSDEYIYDKERFRTLFDHEMIVRMSRITVSVQCNRMFRILLRAPSVLQGLTSEEGIDAGLKFASTLRAIGGTSFLVNISWDTDTGELTIDEWSEFWKHLVPRAGKKFLDSSHHLIINLIWS